jgi:hypothetical protein
MHIPAEELLDLRTVKVATNEEGRACWRAFLAFVEEYLHAGGRRALVMSNPFHKRPDNPFYHSLTLGRAWADWCVCGNFFCFYALDTADTTQIDYVFDDVQAVTTIGVLVRDVELPWHVDLPQATIDDMATRADYVLLNSYDDSGMLIWSRTGTLKSQ